MAEQEKLKVTCPVHHRAKEHNPTIYTVWRNKENKNALYTIGPKIIHQPLTLYGGINKKCPVHHRAKEHKPTIYTVWRNKITNALYTIGPKIIHRPFTPYGGI